MLLPDGGEVVVVAVPPAGRGEVVGVAVTLPSGEEVVVVVADERVESLFEVDLSATKEAVGEKVTTFRVSFVTVKSSPRKTPSATPVPRRSM